MATPTKKVPDATAPRWHKVRALTECFIGASLRQPGEVFDWYGITVPRTGQIAPVESAEMPSLPPAGQPLMGNLPVPGTQVLGLPPASVVDVDGHPIDTLE